MFKFISMLILKNEWNKVSGSTEGLFSGVFYLCPIQHDNF